MISLRTTARFAFALLGATALLFFPGCGGSSSNTATTSSGPVATFTPDATKPAPAIALAKGAASTGANVNVNVTVTGVTGFFGAAFRIDYNTTALLFNGMTNDTSFLRTGVTDSNVLFLADATSQPGQVLVTATRIDPTVAPPVDVTTTAVLVTLNFTARQAIVAATTEGRLDFGDPKQVCDGSVVPPGCGAIAVNWAGGGVSAQ